MLVISTTKKSKMQNRDKDLKDIRPAIPTITEVNVTTVMEQFQNKTLRPILKFQNQLLLKSFQQYIIKRKNKFHQLPPIQKLEYIQKNIRNDLKFRNLLTGIIIGHFTLEEFDIYQNNESELSRRITSLLIQRLQDQVDEFSIITAV